MCANMHNDKEIRGSMERKQRTLVGKIVKGFLEGMSLMPGLGRRKTCEFLKWLYLDSPPLQSYMKYLRYF